MRKLNTQLIEVIQRTSEIQEGRLIYFNRTDFLYLKTEYQPTISHYAAAAKMNTLLGMPIMLHHSIASQHWELINQSTGDLIASGPIWDDRYCPSCNGEWCMDPWHNGRGAL